MVSVKLITKSNGIARASGSFGCGDHAGQDGTKIGTDIRALIRRMSKANPLWGAPRIHGELLKLGIKINRARRRLEDGCRGVQRSPPRPGGAFCTTTCPTLRRPTCLVVVTATFRLLYALIVLSLDRRRVVHFEVTRNHNASLAFRPNDRGLSLGQCTALSAAGPRQIVWSGVPPSRSRDGYHGGHHCSAIALAKSPHRASHRFDPPRMPGSRCHPRRVSIHAASCRVIFNIIMNSRTHLSLNKDCPRPRRVQLPSSGTYCLPRGRRSASSLRASSRVRLMWRHAPPCPHPIA